MRYDLAWWNGSIQVAYKSNKLLKYLIFEKQIESATKQTILPLKLALM